MKVEPWIFKVVHFMSLPIMFILAIFVLPYKWMLALAYINLWSFFILRIISLFGYSNKTHEISEKKNAKSNITTNNYNHRFSLCSKWSIKYAFETIQILINHNESTKTVYKSYQSLSCGKEDLQRSFYFLLDCIHFCKNDKIYQNKSLLNNLTGLQYYMAACYLDVDPNEIPSGDLDNASLGEKHDLKSNLDLKQLAELKLINWRKKIHWQYWAKSYGEDSLLGRYCIEQANSL